jgi:hypothetical protein
MLSCKAASGGAMYNNNTNTDKFFIKMAHKIVFMFHYEKQSPVTYLSIDMQQYNMQCAFLSKSK